MYFALLCNICWSQELVEAAGAARPTRRGWRLRHTRGCNQSLRFAGSVGGGCRVHRGSAETGNGEGDDEGANGEGFHGRISPWQ
jgi:hypothetical protein